MKSILLSLVILVSCIAVSAHQPVSPPSQPQRISSVAAPAVLHFATAAQQQAFYRYRAGRHTQAQNEYDTLSRLISRRTDTTGVAGPGFTPIDTSYLSYTGTHGGDDNSPWSGQKYDVDVFQFYDNTADTGINNLEYVQTFDANNNILTNTQLLWSGASWQDNAEYIYSYDANQRLDTISYYQAAPGGFAGVWQSIYQYDASGNLLSEIDLLNGGTWDPYTLYTYEYNANNQVISHSWSTWTGAAWQGMTSDTLLYGGSGLLASDYEDTIIGTTSVNYYLTVYNYAGNVSPLDSVVIQWWNDNNNQYLNLQKNLYTYSANEIINETELWDSTILDFYPVSRQVYLYTADSLVASQTGQFPIFVGLLSWGNSTLDTFLYDGNGNTVFYGNETWNGTGWGSQGDENFIWSYNNYNQWVAENYAVLDTPTGWYPTSNYYWWYQLYAVPTGIKDVAKNFASDVYPNPFTHTFTVAYDAESGGTATLLLYDITGRLVTRTVAPASPGSNTLIWDAGYTLPAGMYTYELSLGNAVSRGKVLSNE